MGKGLWSSPPASSALPRRAGVVPWARSSWCGHVAPWVAEPQQVRPKVAQGWVRSCTAGRGGCLAQASLPPCRVSPSHPTLSTKLTFTRDSVDHEPPLSTLTHEKIAELKSTYEILGPGSPLRSGGWGGGVAALSPLRKTDKETDEDSKL